jgi:hypothetical protein
MKEYNQEKILYVLNTGVTSRNLTITEEVSNKIGIDKGCSLINLEDNKKGGAATIAIGALAIAAGALKVANDLLKSNK